MKWEWQDASDPYTGVFVTPLIANFNDDNGDGLINADDVPDIVVATVTNSLSNGYMVAIDGRTGQQLWKTLVNHHSLSDLAVGGIDGDGGPEVVNIQCGPYCWDRRLVVLDNEGAIKLTGEWVDFGLVHFVPDGITLSDLDGDGKSEILWGENVHDNRPFVGKLGVEDGIRVCLSERAFNFSDEETDGGMGAPKAPRPRSQPACSVICMVTLPELSASPQPY